MITGKELIMYILQNNLENKPISFKNDFLNLLPEKEAALKFGVGLATIRAWYECDIIDGIKVGDKIFIFPEAKPQVKQYELFEAKIIK